LWELCFGASKSSLRSFMLLELAAAKWRSRWYYVMLNKTSGMRYVGQTYNLTTRSYCGSGQYWVAHCTKHGGYGRKNIEIAEKFWSEDEVQAQQWLDAFEAKNPDYFLRGNTTWANRARETTGNSAFCGVTQEKRLEYAKAGGIAAAKIPGLMSRMAAVQGKANAESGHMQRIQKIGCFIGGKIAGSKNGQAAVANGQLARAAVLGGKTVSLIRHKEKDTQTGKSKFAVELGKASGVTRNLMKQFCKQAGIAKPGTNYVNIDKATFEQWRACHAS
jgi:hypothetical protein